MSPRPTKAVTLIELLLAVSLFGLMILAFHNLDIFTRYHIVTSDKRVQLQNECSYLLEHMAKQIGRAIGDISAIAVEGTDSAKIYGDKAITVWIDYDNNGLYSSTSDRRVAYRYRSGTAVAANNYNILYYSNCLGANCSQAGSSTPEVLARHITAFDATYTSGNNYVNVSITSCWDPDNASTPCGSGDNPQVSMNSCIYLPTLSTH